MNKNINSINNLIILEKLHYLVLSELSVSVKVQNLHDLGLEMLQPALGRADLFDEPLGLVSLQHPRMVRIEGSPDLVN